MSNPVSLYLPDIEQHLLGLILHDPSTYADVSMLEEKDFGEIRQPVFKVIRQQLDSTPPQSIAPIVLVEKLKAYGKTTIGEVDALIYLEGLQRRGRLIEKKEAEGLYKLLKLHTVKRESIEKIDKAKIQIAKAESFNDIIGAVDQTMSGVNTDYFHNDETIQVFEGMIDKIEEEGNHPLEPGKIAGLEGPFSAITQTIGSLSYRGAMVVVGARTNQGKSSLSWFYNMLTAEKNKVKMLTLDAAEMTPDEIQYRTVCALSKGEIPYWALENRQWRKHPHWEKMIRGDIWPRIQMMEKLGISHYKNIGTMNPKDIIRFIRRFYFNKIGRGNFLIINYDYFKGMASLGRNNVAEYQLIGDFINELKTLITEEIDACVWGGVQNNKTGITLDNPKEKGPQNSENDGQMGLSDRIIQQATHGFIMRYKTPEEIGHEKNRFGNVKLVPVKKRKMTGPRYEELLYPVKLPSGRHVNNYFNLESRGFGYTCKGSLKDMMDTLGHTAIDLAEQIKDEKMP